MARVQVSHRKKTKPRSRKRLILFSAEGHNKTETFYLKDFTKEIGNIKLIRSHDNSTDPVGMVNGLISTMEDTDFDPAIGDSAFCIFDMDCNRDKEKQIKEALQIAKGHNIQLIISNPCFELWFLCHYIKTPKPYLSSNELLKDINKFIPNYEKAQEGIYQIIRERTSIAIQNAENLEKKALNNGYKKYAASFSPTTDMYKVARQIMMFPLENPSELELRH